jgi:hypothetical protein
MRLRALALGLGMGLVLAGLPRAALAFEREWHLGAAAGVSNGHGLKLSPALGAYAAYGISDVFDVRAELLARGYQIGDEKNPHALMGSVGLAYKLDVLRWVPWAGVYVGYQELLEPPPAGSVFKQRDMVLGLGLGLDYAFTRKLGVGVTLRFDQALAGQDATTFDALLRAEYRWGW